MPFTDQKFLFLDCQTTGLSPKNAEILEVGWSLGIDRNQIRSALTLPSQVDLVPRKVWKITGLSAQDFAAAESPEHIWGRLVGEATSTQVTAAVIHYAAFELSFLQTLHQRVFPGADFPWPVICTYRLAKRLCPQLPAKTLRALSGYLGNVLPATQRCHQHVAATQAVWTFLVGTLQQENRIEDWESFLNWHRHPEPPRRDRPAQDKPPSCKKPTYSVTPEARKALPVGPGIYQMLSSDGKVLYIGKATSLRSRVASYFQHRRGDRQKLPELMTQVHEVRVIATETALEAAILEADLIKKSEPFYNAALKPADRRVLYCQWDLANHSTEPSAATPLGPFTGTHNFDSVAILMRVLQGTTTALDHSILTDSVDTMRPILETVLRELGENDPVKVNPLQLCKLGKHLGPPPIPTLAEPTESAVITAEQAAERIRASILRKLRRPSKHIHRARWMAWMLECRVVWKTGGKTGPDWRFLVFSRGQVGASGTTQDPATLPRFTRTRLPVQHRRQAVTLATYDRVRVLMTELEIIAKKSPVLIEFSSTRSISNFSPRASWASRPIASALADHETPKRSPSDQVEI